MANPGAFPSSDPMSAVSHEGADMRFEAVVIPVANVARPKEFYTKLEWRLYGPEEARHLAQDWIEEAELMGRSDRAALLA